MSVDDSMRRTIAEQHDDIGALKAENAKLRESNDMLAKMLGDRTVDCYKLRELVRDMRKAFIHNACYRWCEHKPEPCHGACQYLRRIHELGVEIDASWESR